MFDKKCIVFFELNIFLALLVANINALGGGGGGVGEVTVGGAVASVAIVIGGSCAFCWILTFCKALCQCWEEMGRNNNLSKGNKDVDLEGNKEPDKPQMSKKDHNGNENDPEPPSYLESLKHPPALLENSNTIGEDEFKDNDNHIEAYHKEAYEAFLKKTNP